MYGVGVYEMDPLMFYMQIKISHAYGVWITWFVVLEIRMELGMNVILETLMVGTIIPQISWMNPYLLVSLLGKIMMRFWPSMAHYGLEG